MHKILSLPPLLDYCLIPPHMECKLTNHPFHKEIGVGIEGEYAMVAFYILNVNFRQFFEQ